ncbi:hypothetical protein Mycch_4024 [Mycolicibacterium chubuense NBB4]|uniref:Protein kinase n=1 Tax=Mycolicibacterium chubuense (strain NBB4) TaxID=710421 RepID=I4BN90_MYCCN|nr:hypothetical protein [Mycolicibacterium chubuense]AFM18747.1 hypothetical protein Mycch_4024 [Mycolicibacterium chubuense NBB4]
MPTDHPPGRRVLGKKASAVSIVVASAATLVILFAIMTGSHGSSPQVQSIPAPPTAVSQRTSAPVKPEPVATRPPAATLAMDEHGFVGSDARCDSRQQAVVIARTERSAIVVCRASDGSYEYEGVRLHDGAFLRLNDVRPIAAGFEARNDTTTYRLSPTELVVISGETLQSRDPIVEYRTG